MYTPKNVMKQCFKWPSGRSTKPCRKSSTPTLVATTIPFVTREYLLNLILFYREAHGQFPQGAVCIVERWAWQGEAFKRAGRWMVGWFWRFMRREDFKSPGFWVHLPSVQGFDQSAETNQSN
jgi:hypothetical protein